MVAVAVDVVHALLMVAWVLGLPMLVWHRWPRLTRAYAWYSVAFVVINVVSQWTLDECFLTTVARFLWKSGGSGVPDNVDEWFSVRFAELVFRMTPSHAAVKRTTEALIFATAVGVLYTMRKLRAIPARSGAISRDDVGDG